MNNLPKCQDLFTLNDFFRHFLQDYDHPFNIIPSIQEIVREMLSNGLDGFGEYKEGVFIGEGVHIADSALIEAPAIIGAYTKIRHGAYLRGSVVIGEGCVIGNSTEIKNSIIMDRVQAPHYNYIGDSILGNGVHLGAGAICSNLRSDKANVRIRVDNDTVDTGMRKLGAILGDNVEVGCGSILCPGVIIGKSTVVYPLTLARGVYPANSIVKQSGEIVERQ